MCKLLIFPVLVFLSLFFAQIAKTQVIDPHKLYESRCSRCHESHASEFVNDNLKVDGNRLIGKQTGKEVNLILKMHRGTNLSEPETSALIKHFLAIQSRAGLYRQKCIICHDSAVKLARQRLILHDGKLYGRYSGINIEPFLNSHGRLTEREIIVVTDMVKSQLSTASSN